MKNSILTLALLFFVKFLAAQADFPYQITLEPIAIDGLDGLHSFAFGQHDGKWLLLAGRRDGIHARQPFNAFPAAQNNTEITVVDPVAGQVWSAPLTGLPTGLQEQLQATNLQFSQDGETLYLLGGYGYSSSAGDHVTYPYLTAVNLPGLVADVLGGTGIAGNFKQLEDEKFAVTGGHLAKIDDHFYLAGGHRFDGRYNPMNHPTFTQTYTNQVRVFQIENTPNSLNINDYSEMTDPVHLHRRDYNLLPQIFPNGEFGFTIFSGVFQLNQDLPFLYPVDVRAGGYEAHPGFNQYLSNYHSACLPLYDEGANAMHNLFFGGLSQYYFNGEELVQDDNVPFVKTVSRVSRAADGTLAEVRLPVEMPGYLGASAEFIPAENLPEAALGVFALANVPSAGLLLGHIVGGIESSELNPFTFNNTGATAAAATVFAVYLSPETATAAEEKVRGYHGFRIAVSPNPNNGRAFQLEVDAPEAGTLEIILYDTHGRLVLNEKVDGFPEGKHKLEVEMETEQKGNFFLSTVLNGKFAASTNLVIE